MSVQSVISDAGEKKKGLEKVSRVNFYIVENLSIWYLLKSDVVK